VTVSETLRLFLIEDDDDIALLVRKSLERAGHQVTRCRTAADALIVLGHNAFDLVLLDQRLPDMPGADLLQALAREGIPVPVLMVTAYGDEQLATQVLRGGALDYVVKDPALTFLSELPKRVQESVLRHRLQQMNRLLTLALESARDGILITDLQGQALHVNRAFERITGYTRTELLGRSPWGSMGRSWQAESETAPPPQRSTLEEEVNQSILARTSWQGECTIRKKDGPVIDGSLTASPIVDEHGQLTHSVAILRDNTERKALERQLLQAQKMQSVGTLAGGVAHEFNNLLAGINGYASLGLRELERLAAALSAMTGSDWQATAEARTLAPSTVRHAPASTTFEDLRQFLQHIVALSERAASLTRQMLTFARKPTLSRKPTPVGELLRSTAELVTRTLHTEVVVDIQSHGSDGASLLVEADPNLLQQALINLALNARDALAAAGHRPLTGVTVTEGNGHKPIAFRLRQVQHVLERSAFPQNVPPGDYIVLEVADQGCGMPEKVLNQALDPFFTTKEVGKGTGLGLPMVFGIIQAHQGFLGIDSEPGRGTCVSLYLPRLHSGAGPGQADASLFESGQVLEPESTPGRQILVIDDEEAVQDVVRRFLEIAGHHVVCAGSGQDALAVLGTGQAFDLVILDLMMPREDGAATFQRLRQRRPRLPVLLCTGLPQTDPAPQLLEAGAVGIMRKPFRMNELWYAVNEALAASVV
jgi:two-component system cell cycle sensor histidine kinase/response regulator CckA